MKLQKTPPNLYHQIKTNKTQLNTIQMETNTMKDVTNHRMIDITSLEFINQIAQILPKVLNLKQSDDNEFIDDTQVTQMLGIKKATLHSLTSKRILTYYQPCKANLFKKADVLAFIESSKRPNRAEITESAENYLIEKDKVKNRISRRDRTWTKSKTA